MKEKKNTAPNRLWLYVAAMVVLLGVLLFLMLRKSVNLTNPPSVGVDSQTGAQSGDTQQTTSDPSAQTGTANNSGSGAGPTQTQETSTSQQEQGGSGGGSESGSGGSSTNNSNSAVAPIGCSTSLTTICTIKKDDDIYQAIGQDPDSELWVNGVKVKPEVIVYQTGTGTYPDEQIQDGQGKVLSSTQKEYDTETETLTLTIGANPSYYNNLRLAEQRTLYLSQTVRSFMAMFGETPDNFIKVEQAVGNLGSWQPAP